MLYLLISSYNVKKIKVYMHRHRGHLTFSKVMSIGDEKHNLV